MRKPKRNCLWAISAIAFLAAAAGVGCGRSPREKAALYIESGKKLAENSDHSRAILQFRNAAKETPEAAEPWYRLGLSMEKVHDAGGAVASFHRAIQLDPRHIGAQVRFAEFLIASREKSALEEALERLGRALSYSPDDLDLQHAKAAAEIGLGRFDDADATVARALRKAPGSVKSQLMLALTRVARQDLSGAETILKTTAEQSPSSADAAVALGKLYLLRGKPGEAQVQFRRALDVDARNAPALLETGAMQLSNNRGAEAEQTYKRLAALPDSRFKLFHALFLLQAGKPEAATSELERLFRADSRDRAVRGRLVKAYMEAGRIAEAGKILDEAIEKNSKDADARLLRAELLLKKGELAKAQEDTAAVMRYRPESAEARLLQARIDRKNGSISSSRQNLSEVLRLNPTLLEARLELAQILLDAGDPKGSLEIIDGAAESQRSTVSAIIVRNWALISLGRLDEARAAIEKASSQSNASDLLLQDGLLKARRKNYVAARSALEAALSQDPDDVRALSAIAGTYLIERQPAKALDRVRAQIAARPQSPALQHYLGVLLVGRGDKAGARVAFEAAISGDRKLVAAQLDLARLEISENRADAGRTILATVRLKNPRNTEAALMLGMLEETLGNKEQAGEQYRQVLHEDDRNVLALNNLAYLLAADEGKLDEALKYAERARELAPESLSSVDHTLGWIYYRKGIYRTSVKYLETAVSRKETPLRKFHLAMAYLKAGDIRRGRQTLDAALKMDPTLPEAKTSQDLLRQISDTTTKR